jgi:hypothetical protein
MVSHRESRAATAAYIHTYIHTHIRGMLIHIMAYRLVTKRWLCKQRQFLGNGSVNTFPRQRSRKQQQSSSWMQRVFYVVRAEILWTEQFEQWVQLSSVKESVKTESWVREAEESITVRSRCQWTVGEDIVGWKMFSGFCGYLWIMEISGSDVIACSYQSCVQVANKLIQQSKLCI